jgi:hypothetical protein
MPEVLAGACALELFDRAERVRRPPAVLASVCFESELLTGVQHILSIGLLGPACLRGAGR